MRPLCFILMPFGKKPDAGGILIDFDIIYKKLIAPAVREAGLEPLRADEEMTCGIIHKPMFERLVLCEYAIADLTTANANVFYELGIRHAARSWSTVLIFAEGSTQLPFDVASLRALPYKLDKRGIPVNLKSTNQKLVARLRDARSAATDSPIYQHLENYPDIDHTKTDTFREVVNYSTMMKDRLSSARKQGVRTLRSIENELRKKSGSLKDVESGVIIDLFLSYRAVKAWDEMIRLFKNMSLPLSSTIMVQEQFALALNRAGSGEDAERVLLALLKKRGPSSETYGILGRVYKDHWERAKKKGAKSLAEGLLDKAIDAYLKGFEADWRDAYPGINATTLMELKTPPDERRKKLMPVVTFAVERRIASGKPDYWDHATLLELAVLAKDKQVSEKELCNALAVVRESWEPETTARNLKLIRETRERRGEKVTWAVKIERELKKRAQE